MKESESGTGAGEDEGGSNVLQKDSLPLTWAKSEGVVGQAAPTAARSYLVDAGVSAEAPRPPLLLPLPYIAPACGTEILECRSIWARIYLLLV